MLNNNIDKKYLGELIKVELCYAGYVSAKLLYFYGYNSGNVVDFFYKKDQEHRVKNNIPSMYYYLTKGMYYLEFNRWIHLLNNNLVLDSKFFEMEKEIINECIKKGSKYLNLLIEAMKVVENTNNLSLQYTLMDDKCLDIQQGGFNKKYILNLYKYV